MQWTVERIGHVSKEITTLFEPGDRGSALLAYTHEFFNATRYGCMGNLATDSFETTIKGERHTVRLLPVVEVR